ncbi:MAG: NADH-quinone oxidoreductase subunit M [Candidatus Omnitrophica bacterium]|nr:NADH-quinone oxidoreductase subunit M [Candidatus Omnitrophota bacterium]
MSHLLSWIVFSPLVAGLGILFVPKSKMDWVKWIATGVTGFGFFLGLLVWAQFNPLDTGVQLLEDHAWIPQIGVHYTLGLDGINFPMVILTLLLSFLACIGSFGIQEREKEYYFLYLLLTTGMLGTFLALDLFLFYIFWEVVLVPMYFLIGIWGGPRKEYAAIKFFLYTLAGSLFMLLGILALYFFEAPHTFNMLELGTRTYPLFFQQVIFLAFFFGFAIKVPVWPFHTWLPDAHVEAPTPISVLLAGVLLKMGTYGFFRVSYPILPEAAQWFRPAMAVLAVIGIVYGGFVALAQQDFKKMVAYSSVSHMGFVLLGLAAFTRDGFNGAMLQMFNHGVITGGLFLLVGVLYDRAHTRDLNVFGGLGARMSVYSGILIFFSLASLGLPGLSGFVSEFLCLLGTFPVYRTLTILSLTGIILAATYLLLMIQRVLLGPVNPKWEKLADIDRRELFTLVPLMIPILVVGIYPKLILHYLTPSLSALLTKLGVLIP